MKQKSKYAAKRESGKMMYGPGCCGHSLTPERIRAVKQEARREGRITPNSPWGYRSQHYQE